jgi:hypothetical protein
MAKVVEEIMNREMFNVRADESAERALGFIVALGITGAPVLDERRRAIGMASFRDLVGQPAGTTVGDRMTRPALTVSARESIAEAARRIGETGVHRLVVVDDEERATGVVSAIDVIRALVGMPAAHPATFPHHDRTAGVSFTDDTELDLARVDVAPDGPGVLVLIDGGAGRSETVVWVEAAANVRTRLYDLLSEPQDDAMLARWLAHPSRIRFRAASVPDASRRERIAETLRRQAASRVEAAAMR